MYRSLLLPAGILAATIIGAGIFALPYVMHESGILTGAFYLIFFAIILSLIHLMYADVLLNSTERHRLAGYARIHLGKFGYVVALLTTILGMAFALTIYLVLSISFVNLLLPDLPDVIKLFAFWLISSFPIIWTIKRTAFSELLITLGIILIIFIILGYGMLVGFEKINGFTLINPVLFFFPFGAVLFSLSGRVAIPIILDYFKKENSPIEDIRHSIILGTSLPAVVYFLFVLGIFGISNTVSPDAISGLINVAPAAILWAIGILGFVSLWSTYIIILQYLKNTFELDLKLKGSASSIIAILLPLAVYFLGFRDFIYLIGISGAIFAGLDAILVVLIWRKLDKTKIRELIKHRFGAALPYGLLIIFIIGIILKIVN